MAAAAGWVCGVAAWTPAARAASSAEPPSEDGVEYTAVEEVFFEIMNPVTLPGREAPSRERPVPTPPVAKPEAEVEMTAEQKALEEARREAEREWFGRKPYWTWSRGAGDWGGDRMWLEDRGFKLEGAYVLDWQSVWSGGVRNEASTAQLWGLSATLDSQKLAGYTGGTLFADFYSTSPNDGADPGSFQNKTNLDSGDSVTELAEVWYEQVLFEGVLRLKIGKVDASSEFAFTKSGSEFMESSAGVDPTILGMPTYPDPATSINVFVHPTNRWYIGAGFYDGASGVDGVHTGRQGPASFFSDARSNDWFWIGETGLTWRGLWREGKGRLAGGVWHHTGEWRRFDGGVEQGTTGFYAVLDQRLWGPAGVGPPILSHGTASPSGGADPHAGAPAGGEPDDDRGLWLLMQCGYGDENVSEAARHFAVGLVLKGMFADREGDAAGMYVSWVDLSAAAGFQENETGIEWFYRYQVTPFVSVKPDLQLFINPSGNPNIDDALVGGMRLEMVF